MGPLQFCVILRDKSNTVKAKITKETSLAMNITVLLDIT